MYDIVCIGNPVYDIIKTPYVETKERELSGCSTNAAVFAAALGAKVLLIGAIGDDYRTHFEKEMARRGVDTYLLPSKRTGGFDLFYFPNGDRRLRIIDVADPIEDIPEKLLEAKLILLGPVIQEIKPPLIEKIRKSTDAIIFADIQGFIRFTDGEKVWRKPNPEFNRYLTYIDFLKPNEFEAEVFTGIYPRGREKEALEKMREMGVKNPIITLAEAGSIALDEDGNFYKISAYKTEAKDPTGAGDSYAGSFAFYYLKTKDLFEAAKFASAAASLMVEEVPSRVEVKYEEVLRRMKEIEDACKMERLL